MNDSNELIMIGKDPDHPYTVQQLSERVAGAISKWGNAWVEGELIKFQYKAGGHAYPQLRDLTTGSTITLLIFAGVLGPSAEEFADGDRVLVSGNMDYYIARGSISLKVTSMKKVGIGVLMAEIEARRAKIIAEGLADQTRKQRLPFLPGVIGLITASGSDAEKDVKQNVLLRWPEAQFKMISVSVQGADCARSVVAALEELDNDPLVEVIIITRGGGSFLDLVGFSDEALVRRAAAARTPIISAIGHENDNPILDNVADLRASTPTDAAKRVVPDVVEERKGIGESLVRMKSIIGTFVTAQSTLIQQIRQHPLLKDPHTYLNQRNDDLVRAISELRDDIGLRLDRHESDLVGKRSLLRSLSPQSTLDRGYSVLRDSSGKVITDPAQVKAGDSLKLRVAKGDLNATAN